MSKKDKVFFFVERLKSWTRTKLYEKKFKRLLDYGDKQRSQKKNVLTPNPKNRISKPNSPRNFSNDKKSQTPSTNASQGAYQSNLNHIRLISYFLCKGPIE